MADKRPKITCDIGPGFRTPLQAENERRAYVMWAAHEFGCSIRLIASVLKLDPARVRQVLEEFEDDEDYGENSPPEDSL